MGLAVAIELPKLYGLQMADEGGLSATSIRTVTSHLEGASMVSVAHNFRQTLFPEWRALTLSLPHSFRYSTGNY